MLARGESWVGPFQIRKLLETAFNANADKWKPPAQGSAYLVTRRTWRSNPKSASVPLYVGGITGKSHRFRTRIGDLLADAFGFYTETTGHSSGGQSLHDWCCENRVNALDLYIAWVTGTRCHKRFVCTTFSILNSIAFIRATVRVINQNQPLRFPNPAIRLGNRPAPSA